jgi:SAM-dependent methyltransferase
MDAPVSFDRVADRYDETRGGLRRGRDIAASIRPWLGAGPVLEVGVGTGVVATALTDAGVDVLGVDISAAMARRAYERIGARVVLGDARRLPIASATVAGVLFVWVLHLAGDIPAAFAESARVLRPGGRVVALHDGPESTPTDMDAALALLAPLRDVRPDRTEALAAAAHTAGLTTVHLGPTDPYPMAHSPAELADRIDQRVWSYLWRVDDATWQSHVRPAVAALRALPDPERPRPYTQRQRISVFARP